jgi:penicillin-binding protein 1A
MLALVGLAALSLAAYTAWLSRDLPDTRDIASYRPPTATRVFAWDGTLIGEYSDERRIYIPYEQIPSQLVDAFVAGEDKNFFRHSGIDVGGISRAMIKNIVNAATGRRLEGGSTITQQVAKNILLSSETTIARKLKEAIVASRLEQQLSKEHILELYLNEIWLGYRSYGVSVAAYNYFGKPLDQLSLGESAYLAALPKGPDNYHPLRRREAAISRRNYILDQMVETGAITRAEAQQAKAEEFVVRDNPTRADYDDADFFVEEVRRQALDRFGDEINKGGYYIRTTLDSRLQVAARDALMTGLESYDRRHGWRGAWGRAEGENWREQAQQERPPSERDAWRTARVQTIDGNNIWVQPAQEDMAAGTLVRADVTWARNGRGLNVGDLVFVEPAEEAGQYLLKQIPQVNGALVALDPQTGRVVAMVGGYSYSPSSSFNRATQAMRQPGSAFKPFVYATALENDFTPASVILDAPISLIGADGQVWSPENYSRDSLGPLLFRRGLELSRNTMTVRVARQIGMPKIVENAIKYGIVDQMDPVLSMSLGAGETTPIRLAGAYAMFANGGRRIEPHLIEIIQDRDGNLIYGADPRECPRCDTGFNGSESPRLPITGEQVMNPVTAYQISLMLQGVVQRGTAARAASLGRPLGGKTGTTNDYRSAWFMGFSPDLVVGVFVGFDDNRSLGNGETGSSAALPIFIDFIEDALEGTPVRDFQAPPEAKFALVNGIREAFRPGTMPQADQILSTAIYESRPTDPIDLDGFDLPGQIQPPAPPPQPRLPPQEIPDDFQGLF